MYIYMKREEILAVVESKRVVSMRLSIELLSTLLHIWNFHDQKSGREKKKKRKELTPVEYDTH